jgi:FtsP/CotA-like multicopper oxidase with cupredoxin domain
MSAVVVGLVLVSFRSPVTSGVTRTYYIAAEDVEWDYAPSGVNRITGKPFGSAEAIWMESGPHRIGRVYKKALYYEYTDSTFAERISRPPEWEHLGMLGPLIRAEVGDTIVVMFRNKAGFPASVHPHGVFYDKDSEGAPYVDQTDGADKHDDGVPPGGTHTYVWPVPERAGPAAGDPSSILWMYHSHTNDVRDVNAGLMGPMIVSADGSTGADGTPRDVDRELVVTFQEVFENESWYIEENIRTYSTDPDAQTIVPDPFGGPIVLAEGYQTLGDYNLMESLNGFVYGNLDGLTMRVGERVRWYIMATTNFELHTPHWHGNVVTIGNQRTDVASLLTMGMLVADMVPDNPGEWLFHCHTGPHLVAGMQAVYSVEPVASTAGS